MFDFNVICFENNGSTKIEYSLNGKTCVDHNNESGDNIISFTSVEDNNCKDIYKMAHINLLCEYNITS